MRFLFWGINYAPESTGIAPYTTEWADWLVARGHEVEVVSTFRYYPEWRKQPGDVGCWRRRERVGGVQLTRCWHFVPARPGSLWRILHEASFVLSSADVVARARADVVVAVLPPLALGAVGRVLSRISGKPLWIHVQDLQPDAALALGMLRPSLFTRLMYGLESYGYGGAIGVSSIIGRMNRRLAEKPAAAGKLHLLHNWVRGGAPAPVDAGEVRAFRERIGVPEGGLLVSYSGNLGQKQGLEVVIEAARRTLGNRRLRWLLVGSGGEHWKLRRQAAEAGVTNLQFLPLLEAGEYAAMLQASDLCLVTQRPGTGAYFFPSKVLSLWQAGRPVLACADSGGALDIELRESGGGWSVPAGDAEALVGELDRLLQERPEVWKARGEAGREWVERRYGRDRLLEAWLGKIGKRLAEGRRCWTI